MQKAVQDFFATDVSRLQTGLAELERCIPPNAVPQDDLHLQQLTALFTEASKSCLELEKHLDADTLQQTRQQFFETLSPWLDQCWSGQRAREKPRGYAGDYELLSFIYDNCPQDRGLPGYLDLFLLNLPLTRAIRSRWQKIREFLITELGRRDGNVSILNIASGACREYREPLEPTNDRQITLQCLDNDQLALDFVRDNVTPGSGITDFRLNKYNVLRLLSSENAQRRFGTFDIVYSIGLFDYIPDEPLIKILTSCRELLKPGGVAYINFKDAERYDKTPYQWWMDWHFYQRTVEDCQRLFEAAGYDMANIETSRDDTEIIVNFVSRVPATMYRFDYGTESHGTPTAWQHPWQDSKES